GGGEKPDRHIDKEHPAPIELVSQPAAERRADNRAQYDPHAPDRHRLGMALWRIDLQEHRLRQRHKRRSADTLQQTVYHYLRKARGHAAQGRGQGKTGDREEKHVFDAKAAGEPARQRRHDRRRDDVRGHDPGDLVLRGGKAALHMRQRDVGDRGVDPLHEGRQHDRDRDRTPVGDWGGGFARHRSAACVVEPASHPNSRPTRSSQGRRCSVSTSTVTLNPAWSGASGSKWSMLKRTGRRWTTFTQLPVAFSAGRSEKVNPVPGLKLSTLAGKTTSG